MKPKNQKYELLILFCPGTPIDTADGKVQFFSTEEDKNAPGTGIYLGGPIRMKATVKMYKKYKTTIVVVGGGSNKVELMKRYLMQNGVPGNDIIRIESNPDTNGNLHAIKKVFSYYCKYDTLISKGKLSKIAAVSNKYHKERILLFLKDIMNELKVDFTSAESIMKDDPSKLYPNEFRRRKKNEANGVDQWNKQTYTNQFRPEVEWTAFCHDPNLLHKLWEK